MVATYSVLMQGFFFTYSAFGHFFLFLRLPTLLVNHTKIRLRGASFQKILLATRFPLSLPPSSPTFFFFLELGGARRIFTTSEFSAASSCCWSSRVVVVVVVEPHLTLPWSSSLFGSGTRSVRGGWTQDSWLPSKSNKIPEKLFHLHSLFFSELFSFWQSNFFFRFIREVSFNLLCSGEEKTFPTFNTHFFAFFLMWLHSSTTYSAQPPLERSNPVFFFVPSSSHSARFSRPACLKRREGKFSSPPKNRHTTCFFSFFCLCFCFTRFPHLDWIETIRADVGGHSRRGNDPVTCVTRAPRKVTGVKFRAPGKSSLLF